jgi:PAS domain S-box-containing protein
MANGLRHSPGMEARVGTLFHHTFVRYLFAIATVASTFAIRVWLIPFTGTGASFVLFFAAVLVTSIAAGIGPGICAFAISVPLSTLVTGAGLPPLHAAVQGLLFAVDATSVIYLTFLMKKERQAAQGANQRLRWANEEISRSMARTREVIELAPEAFFQADLDARFTDVNRAACRLLGYERDELIGKTIFEIIPAEDADRLKAARADLLLPGLVHRAEWTQKRKDGTFIPVEVSSNILPDGRWQAFVRDVSERKRIEQALRSSEGEFRELAESMPQIVWAASADGWNIYFNQRWVDYTGLTLKEGNGEGWIIPFHPDDRQRAWDGWQRAVQHRDTYSLECRLRRADGVYQWWLIRGVPLLGASGEIRKWFGTYTDIEQIKRIEHELKDANASLDAIIENIPLMLFIKDSTSLRFLRFNRAGEDLLGAPRQTLLGKSDFDVWPPEQAGFFAAKDRETLNSGTVVDIPEEPIHTRKGVRVLHTKKVPILDDAGNPKYLLGISEDITERRRIEKEQQFLADASVVLSASLDYEQTLASLARLTVQHVADWCVVDAFDEQGQLQRLKVTSADPARAALCAVLEQMPPDRGLPYVMRSVIERKQPLLNEQVTPEFVESMAQGPEHLQALLAMDLTALIVVPLMVRGQALGALALGFSNPSRAYGQNYLQLAEALADRAAVAIENARLYRASVQAARLRDQVLGVVAHDLRNPLSTILLQAGALERSAPEPERRSQKQTEAIRRAATRMNTLIKDLLDVAVMESGQLTINRARLSAVDLVVGAVDMQRPLASSSSLELRVDLNRDVPDIWGDRDRLLQVFENLIGNAIRFTEAGGGITVGATARDHEVVFRVSDTGSGIAPENLPRVFDRFWQANNEKRQGAGLGLPITKGIVEAHGGRIWVESTPHRGTTFSFTIPKATPEQGRPSPSSGSPLLEMCRST